MKKWLADYLSISRKDRVGMLLLMSLVASVWVLPRWLGSRDMDPGLAARADSALPLSKSPLSKSGLLESGQPQGPHAFDPHTASDEELLSLGFTERNVRTMRNYFSKGGRLRQAADIHRLYGISPELADRLEPYVRIPSSAPNHSRTSPVVYRRDSYNRPHYVRMVDEAVTQKKVKRYSMVDLNRADTAELIDLPGIGSKLAARIVLFRERCGGFHSVDQLAEVYGIRDSLFLFLKPRLTITDPQLRLLRINVLEADSLALHPYLTRSEARAIVRYRQQHGPFSRSDDLLRIDLLTPELLAKLSPYLDFN
jgi:competence ComEA-like helix-hairpin-helix protein